MIGGLIVRERIPFWFIELRDIKKCLQKIFLSSFARYDIHARKPFINHHDYQLKRKIRVLLGKFLVFF